MLKELFIENSAVIEKADINFSAGLNVFTGETGAGKSVLIGSISAVCGNRVSREIIRTGAKKAELAAVFDAPAIGESGKSGEIGANSANAANDANEESTILSREITADGKSSARINGKPCTVSELSEAAASLINIHGQRDTAALFSPEFQLSLVDNYGGLEKSIADYKLTFDELNLTAKKLKEAANLFRENTEKLEGAKKAVSDIETLKIKPFEDEETERELRFLENAESYKSGLTAARQALKFTDDGNGALNLVRFATDNIKPFCESSKEAGEYCERLDTLAIELSDLSREISKTADSAVYSEEKLTKLTERKNALSKAKKLYGGSLEAVFETLENSKKLIEMTSNSEEALKILADKKAELLKTATEKAAVLSRERETAAEKLCEEIKDKLSFLDMPNVKIGFVFTKGKLTVNGFDNAEIFISPNIGEDLKPLSKIASGGELSRIMLAVKTVTAKYADVGTMIFDEIDAGVSGRAAEKIGSVLRELSKTRQVIVVTHLAQIAVCADRHMLIEKTSTDRTYTVIKTLNDEERALEIARIQVGGHITETALKNAREQIALKKF